MSIRLVIFFFALNSILPLSAQGYFEINAYIEAAYDAALSLRFDDANEILSQIEKDTPDNLMIHQIANYIDFFTIFISEDKALFDQLYSNKNKRLDAVKKGNTSSPYCRFVQAEIHLQWALVRSKFLKSTSGIKAFDMTILNDANQAYKLLEANAKEFPDFKENQKSLGVMHALAGYLPKFVRFLFNVKGSLDQGKAEIEELIYYSKDHDYLYDQEVYVIYAYMMMDLFNDPETAWHTLMDVEFEWKENPLARFVLASLAQKTGRNDKIIEFLSEDMDSDQHFSFPYLDFLLGKAYLRKLDARAKPLIENYINTFQGRHFIKEAYQKLAWCGLVLDDSPDMYQKNIKKCLTEGYELLEDDQQARAEAESGIIPNADLMKSRLLYDGGYLEEASEVLGEINYADLSRTDKLEYNYRSGRVFHKLRLYDKARIYYTETIILGRQYESFFACNASLQLGLIYEYFNELAKAKKFFNLCRDIDSPKYRKDLHNKAKAGIERISD